MDGGETAARLARPFQPRENEIEITLPDQDLRLAYPLYDLCCIKLHGKAASASDAGAHPAEEVETATGEKFRVQVMGREKYPLGFYGLPIDRDSPFKSIFFTFHGVRTQPQERPIGNILRDQGLIDEQTMNLTLLEQQKLRTRRVGEIIAEQQHIPQSTIDREVDTVRGDMGRVPKNIRVGDILVAAGLVTREQVEEALSTQEKGKKKRIGTLLIEKGLITETQLLSALATKFGLRFIDLENLEPSPDALEALPREVAVRMRVLPVEVRGRVLTVATSQPTDPTIGDNLRFTSDLQIELVVACSEQITQALESFYVKTESQVRDLIGELSEAAEVENEEGEDSQFNESDSQIINLVNKILIDGYKKGVSDIHFEPGLGKQPLGVRYRIDGVCQVVHKISPAYRHAVIARVKIMSRLDIAEHRRPQSGKILLRYEGKKIEYRVEITPTVGGNEDAVLRILASSKPLPLNQMGFSDSNIEEFERILTKPYGIILCVGPTGSGKTTSLHSALGHINKPDRKIWTAEDPVEITQSGLRQVQVHAKIGFGFKEALRSFLRADPDVIMIGEMRDAETAKTAIEASLTGHLVFSTLHTNSAPETVVRLIEMGMDPYNFADAMLGILAQRLARRLCVQCRAPYTPNRAEYDNLVHAYGEEWFAARGMPAYSEDLTLMRAVGCRDCHQTGYSGRIAIHELLTTSEAIRAGIKKGVMAEELRDQAIRDGMTTLRMDGIHKVFQGITDLNQVLRVCL
ncbi:type II secretion system protein E [Geoalkalibacter ferrihydriticus DSM 17813]|uniref:Type II secretion system protein E n=2 Tax=Geoalkalibacter ferrihydriticus TaxID=392333 RepID=A0A0C2HMD9_9BACT|nr:type II secretion system protein E [Geoalkalibacter ferrihydriticus DSM 17813]